MKGDEDLFAFFTKEAELKERARDEGLVIVNFSSNVWMAISREEATTRMSQDILLLEESERKLKEAEIEILRLTNIVNRTPVQVVKQSGRWLLNFLFSRI